MGKHGLISERGMVANRFPTIMWGARLDHNKTPWLLLEQIPPNKLQKNTREKVNKTKSFMYQSFIPHDNRS